MKSILRNPFFPANLKKDSRNEPNASLSIKKEISSFPQGRSTDLKLPTLLIENSKEVYDCKEAGFCSVDNFAFLNKKRAGESKLDSTNFSKKPSIDAFGDATFLKQNSGSFELTYGYQKDNEKSTLAERIFPESPEGRIVEKRPTVEKLPTEVKKESTNARLHFFRQTDKQQNILLKSSGPKVEDTSPPSIVEVKKSQEGKEISSGSDKAARSFFGNPLAMLFSFSKEKPTIFHESKLADVPTGEPTSEEKSPTNFMNPPAQADKVDGNSFKDKVFKIFSQRNESAQVQSEPISDTGKCGLGVNASPTQATCLDDFRRTLGTYLQNRPAMTDTAALGNEDIPERSPLIKTSTSLIDTTENDTANKPSIYDASLDESLLNRADGDSSSPQKSVSENLCSSSPCELTSSKQLPPSEVLDAFMPRDVRGSSKSQNLDWRKRLKKFFSSVGSTLKLFFICFPRKSLLSDQERVVQLVREIRDAETKVLMAWERQEVPSISHDVCVENPLPEQVLSVLSCKNSEKTEVTQEDPVQENSLQEDPVQENPAVEARIKTALRQAGSCGIRLDLSVPKAADSDLEPEIQQDPELDVRVKTALRQQAESCGILTDLFVHETVDLDLESDVQPEEKMLSGDLEKKQQIVAPRNDYAVLIPESVVRGKDPFNWEDFEEPQVIEFINVKTMHTSIENRKIPVFSFELKTKIFEVLKVLLFLPYFYNIVTRLDKSNSSVRNCNFDFIIAKYPIVWMRKRLKPSLEICATDMLADIFKTAFFQTKVNVAATVAYSDIKNIKQGNRLGWGQIVEELNKFLPYLVDQKSEVKTATSLNYLKSKFLYHCGQKYEDKMAPILNYLKSKTLDQHGFLSLDPDLVQHEIGQQFRGQTLRPRNTNYCQLIGTTAWYFIQEIEKVTPSEVPKKEQIPLQMRENINQGIKKIVNNWWEQIRVVFLSTGTDEDKELIDQLNKVFCLEMDIFKKADEFLGMPNS